MSKADGFVVGQQIATHRDTINDDGTLAIDMIEIQLIVKYPDGLKLQPHVTDIEKAIVRLAPAAYMELGRRAG